MEETTPRAANLNTLSDARMRRLPVARAMPRAELPGSVTHLDIVSVSKLDLPHGGDGAARGMKYGLVAVDDASGRGWVYFGDNMRSVPRLLRHWLNELGTHANLGAHLRLGPGFARRVHTDGGTNLNSQGVEDMLAEYGMQCNVTSAHDTPESNGVCERYIQTLLHDTRALLATSGIPLRHWHYAMRHAVVVRNLLATRRVLRDGKPTWMSPNEIFFGRKPTAKHLVALGAPCRVLLLGPERIAQGKLGLPSARGRVLGYGGDGVQIGDSFRLVLGWIVLLDSGKVVHARHVEIDERPVVEGGVWPLAVAGFSATTGRGRNRE